MAPTQVQIHVPTSARLHDPDGSVQSTPVGSREHFLYACVYGPTTSDGREGGGVGDYAWLAPCRARSLWWRSSASSTNRVINSA